MEALLARQLDNYQEKNNLVHPGVHGYRKTRGTATAMMEVWEYVIEKTEKGELVALDFLDCSAGFDSMVHLYILRKREVQFGMNNESLEWLDSYLKGWLQYTVVEAANSTPRRLKNGVPQGGGLSPILWRSATNDLPEAGLKKPRRRRQERDHEAENVQPGQNTGARAGGRLTQAELEEGRAKEKTLKSVISCRIDNIPENRLTTEERLDKELRQNGKWRLKEWKQERTGEKIEGTDNLHYRTEEDVNDVVTTIYADDTQSRASARTLRELEKRNGEGVSRVCKALKALRLKVNESKTTYMIMATQGIRIREDLANKVSTIDVCGQKVKNVRVGKALGLIISDDLTWRDNTTKVVLNCQEKMRGLWKVTNLLRKDQRKLKSEAIILSRLTYCIEITSSGRKCDIERLQGVQSAAARWVLQTRKRDWRLKQGLKKLGWLSMCQQAAYKSILTAMTILKNKKPERLFKALTEEREGETKRKIVDEKKFLKMKLTTRKSWSWRSLRWLEKMPQRLQNLDPTKKGTKNELKKWVRDRVPVRGCRIMWGKKIERGNNHPEAGIQQDREEDGDQSRQEEQGGEQERDGDSEQISRPRNIESEDNTVIGVQGQAPTDRTHQAKNKNKTYIEQTIMQISKTDGLVKSRKKFKGKSKKYTRITQITASKGMLTTSWAFFTSCQQRALGGCGREGPGWGPWKPPWPPPKNEAELC